ncbi:helix-turn-helix domain-containing protein [Halobacillus naozhouensis]|uniref:AraC family transcriptional regulator n=1 Tax=Halobacillus naozhouensis TaxID=554880 RepID=A0ABY8IW75_9BACI|nr:helix-turn-helix domain-containing protein [Halobacillus naozhouensis]WFT74463.1 AraC family transcriptional regulator [Halobacillus naozhouensis]
MDSTIKHYMIDQFKQIRMNNRRNEYFHPSFLMEQQLMEAIIKTDEHTAFTLLKNINKDQRPRLAHTPLRSLKNSLICSCTLFTRAVIRAGVDAETSFNLSDAYILEIERRATAEELDTLEFQMLGHFIQMVEDVKEMPYSHVINRAVTHIHEHILDELDLEQIAKACFVSPCYLSHLFKKDVGVSVVQFINEKRVEESKYFLMHTTTSISDIAALFKFCNQSYYTSIFKKHFKLTPKQYRDQQTRRMTIS